MHYILGFFLWFLMRGPLVLGGAALAILGLGFYLQIGQNERNLAREAAIAAGPPPIVEITKFDEDRDMTALREAHVRAQPVIENGYRLTYSENTGDDYAFMVPLISTNATNDKVVAGVALYTSSSFTFDDITPELMADGITGFGNFGPIVALNGRVTSLGKWQDMTDEAIAEQGLTLAANAVMIRPYLDGRAAALAPSDLTIFQLFSYVAGALGLLALAKMAITKKPEDGPDLPEADPQPAEVFETAPLAPVAAAASTHAAPLWKQRSGLLQDETPYEPAAVEPASPEADQRTAREPRSGFRLRKMLVVIVGAMFFLGLASVVSDLIAQSSPAQASVDIPTGEERMAATVADIVVPDADPNRHWTDIDVAPIAEWFVAKFFLAVSGDADAQILLGMMAGGLIFGLFGLRFYFVMRRTLRPKTTARFDSMGLN